MTLLDLGLSIREKREAAGLSIDDVAARIKVGARILRAIEEGSIEGLPHAVYTKGFVRSFALVVGFDPAELNGYLDRAFPPEIDDAKPEPGPMMRAAPVSGPGRKFVLAVLVLVVLGGLAGGGWYVAVNYGSGILERIKRPFSAITAPTGASNATVAAAPQPDGASAPVIPQNRPAEAAAPVKAPEVPALQPAAQPVPQAAAANSMAPAAPAASAAPVRAANATEQQKPHTVMIKAVRNCWIDVTADGVRGRDFTLQAGKEHTFTYTKSLEIILGNPGGVEIYHDGSPFAMQEQNKPKFLRFP